MNFENRLYQLVYAAASQILKANEYEAGKNYETDLGNYLREWKGAVMPKEDNVVFEIRDNSGAADDEQADYQHEILSYEFFVAAKNSASTASFLRQARADIYRMIGANIDSWRATLNASLTAERGGFTREINYEEKVFGELTVTINFSYEQEYFLIGEQDY